MSIHFHVTHQITASGSGCFITTFSQFLFFCLRCCFAFNILSQPPSEEEDNCDGKNDEDAKGESGSPKQRKKKQGPRHTMPTDLVRKPWRDPDPNPSDTHFRYSYSPSGIGLYSRCSRNGP